jgi:hypothetical protein
MFKSLGSNAAVVVVAQAGAQATGGQHVWGLQQRRLAASLDAVVQRFAARVARAMVRSVLMVFTWK